MLNSGAAKAVLLAAAVALPMSACDGARSRESRDPKTPSGFVVPRWLSLKYDEVNARTGPSEENRILWTYRAKGLPVQVVAETEEWRRICDPDGKLVWVKSGQVDGRRNVMRAKATPLTLRRSAKPDGETAAVLRPRSIARLDTCEAGWCRIEAGDAAGWAPEAELWGVAQEPLCRGPKAAP